MAQPTEQTFYIVKAVNREVKAFNGTILTPEGTITYLSESDGYPSHDHGPQGAKKFNTPPTREQIAKWDGMPWYYNMKSAQIIKVTELRIYRRNEEALEVYHL